MLKNLLVLAVLCFAFQPVGTFANGNPKVETTAKKQFIYVLKLQPNYKIEKNWTPEVNGIVGNHFNHLKELTYQGTVIMAGRTDYDVTNENIFGIVVFEAESKDEATKIMNSDPAVIGKVMTAELHPFSVALMRK